MLNDEAPMTRLRCVTVRRRGRMTKEVL